MAAFVDMTGWRQPPPGRLTVVSLAQMRPVLWRCRCDCGETLTVGTGPLRCGNTKSCGCLQREKARRGAAVHVKVNVRRCPQCSDEFIGTRKQVFCSRGCKEAHNRADWSSLSCQWCGGRIAGLGKGQRPKWCSPACKRAGRAGMERPAVNRGPRPCSECGTVFRPPSPRHYTLATCSDECKVIRASRLKHESRVGTFGDQVAAVVGLTEETNDQDSCRPDGPRIAGCPDGR